MKKLVIAMAVLLSNSAVSAYACTQLEAQMIATAASVESLENGQCRVKLAWTGAWQLNPSYQCPLDIDEVSSFGVITSCNVKPGDMVTGIVYRDVNASPEFIYLY
ncbi:hypothetical protein QJS83_06950 [Bdellovibrio sp. 22V]|uniref:hypothetical protein n=1 Tax=Bdellovibrio TaxID=958 RepID=UPI002543BE9B|nr:hypothetical protein [Bdellovibrio sp. 22V]WII73609.1 hypothetical protein QJS83_06950 [Bdellovibrio sp. 22V]